MKILSLNCHQGNQPSLKDFLANILEAKTYDFLLLQEVDERVLAFLHHPSYQLIRAFNEETGQNGQPCIAYLKKYDFLSKGFKSFASMRKDPVYGFKHPSFSLLWSDFEVDKKIWRLASIHLHSGSDRHARMAELRLAKRLLLENASGPMILCGDYNSVLPYERVNIAKALYPEFVWVSNNLGPTLDSRYSENVGHFPNRIAAFLGLFNIGILLRTDHIFVDQQIADDHEIQCSILPDRVSDHSPVECRIDPVI